MLVNSAWCLKGAITDVSKCDEALKDTRIPNYTIIANLTADVKLFFRN